MLPDQRANFRPRRYQKRVSGSRTGDSRKTPSKRRDPRREGASDRAAGGRRARGAADRKPPPCDGASEGARRGDAPPWALMLLGEGQQRDVAGALHGARELTLMHRAIS